MSPHDWDARSYEEVATGVIALGREVLERLPLDGGETVLDAGCGPGRITEALVARLPRGRVIGVDASPAMIAAASERLGGDPRVRLCVGDLATFELGETVDAVLSTATFHWISDHDALFGRLRAALRPGGRLVAQCGGEGNIAAVRAAIDRAAGRPPFAAHVGAFDPWRYAGAEETERRLLKAGFAQARCWLEPRTVVPEVPGEYFATVMLGAHLGRLPADLRSAFVRAVVAEAAAPIEVDYVRLNIDATA